MAEIKSKIEKLVLLDGNTVELTFNFARLLFLRANGYEKEVAAAMKFISDGINDVLDMPVVFYAAYLCATREPAYTKDEFIALVPWDMEETATLYANLNSKKKIDVSKMRSSAAKQKAK
jgi:hypothetical protein